MWRTGWIAAASTRRVAERPLAWYLGLQLSLCYEEGFVDLEKRDPSSIAHSKGRLCCIEVLAFQQRNTRSTRAGVSKIKLSTHIAQLSSVIVFFLGQEPRFTIQCPQDRCRAALLWYICASCRTVFPKFHLPAPPSLRRHLSTNLALLLCP